MTLVTGSFSCKRAGGDKMTHHFLKNKNRRKQTNKKIKVAECAYFR